MTVRSRNLVYNGCFDIEDARLPFPMGWVPVVKPEGFTCEWSTENAVLGNHTVCLVNTSYTESLAGIVMDQRYSIQVSAGEAYEVSAWMKTSPVGLPLRVITVFMDKSYKYSFEHHVKSVSTDKMQKYSGLVIVPDDVAFAKIAVGVHANPDSLPSETWISWVAFRNAL